MSYYHSPYQKRLLRSPNGILFGVCEGVARRFGVSAFLVRLITLIAFFSTGFFPVGFAYYLMVLLMPVGPEW